METDKLIVGWLVGVTDAGLYFMTQRVGVLPTQELLSPLQRILFPAFSELAGDTPRLRRAVCESINVLASLSLPAGFGFALVAADFVSLALGRQWSPIVPLLVVLVPYLGLRSTLSMTLPCVLALGRTRLLFWVSAVYALVHVPAFVAGTALFGLPGSIWSIVVAGVLYWYLNAWMLRATLEISLGEVMRQLRRPLAATALMVAVVAGLAAVTPLDVLAASASGGALVVKTLLGGAVFCGALYAILAARGPARRNRTASRSVLVSLTCRPGSPRDEPCECRLGLLGNRRPGVAGGHGAAACRQTPPEVGVSEQADQGLRPAPAGDSGGTSRPLSPSQSTSGNAPTRVATTGRPCDRARKSTPDWLTCR